MCYRFHNAALKRCLIASVDDVLLRTSEHFDTSHAAAGSFSMTRIHIRHRIYLYTVWSTSIELTAQLFPLELGGDNVCRGQKHVRSVVPNSKSIFESLTSFSQFLRWHFSNVNDNWRFRDAFDDMVTVSEWSCVNGPMNIDVCKQFTLQCFLGICGISPACPWPVFPRKGLRRIGAAFRRHFKVLQSDREHVFQCKSKARLQHLPWQPETKKTKMSAFERDMTNSFRTSRSVLSGKLWLYWEIDGLTSDTAFGTVVHAVMANVAVESLTRTRRILRNTAESSGMKKTQKTLTTTCTESSGTCCNLAPSSRRNLNFVRQSFEIIFSTAILVKFTISTLESRHMIVCPDMPCGYCRKYAVANAPLPHPMSKMVVSDFRQNVGASATTTSWACAVVNGAKFSA